MNYSEEYKALQVRFHQERPDYGVSGGRWSESVKKLAAKLNTRDILDYACGKQTLQKGLPFPITNYDPFVPGYDTHPERPHGLVVCTDTLEHIEPDCLDAVLDDLRDLTGLAIFMTVATGPAKKFLPDGRNAHLIQENTTWWLYKLLPRFDVQSLQTMAGEFALVALPKEVSDESKVG